MNKFTEYFQYYWKAVIGFIAPGAVSLAGALHSGSEGGSSITSGEVILALIASVVTAAGVAIKSNGPKPGTDSSTDQGLYEPSTGYDRGPAAESITTDFEGKALGDSDK